MKKSPCNKRGSPIVKDPMEQRKTPILLDAMEGKFSRHKKLENGEVFECSKESCY